MQQRPADRRRRPSRAPRSSPRSAGLKGKSAVTIPTSVEDAAADRAGGDQREEGDRQGDHEGEQGDGADLARRRAQRRPGRRRAPPPPARIASSQSPNRLHCRGTKNCMPGEHQQRHHQARRRSPAATFSPSSAVGETRPRVSRGKAFSSRSSASEPATSRTVTKARVSVAATAIAKISSGGEEPSTTSFSTSIGCARRSISGPATSRLSRAWVAKLDHLVRASRAAAPAAAPVRSAFEDLGGRRAGRGSRSAGRAPWNSPPSISRSR